MSLETQEVMRLLTDLSNNENLKVKIPANDGELLLGLGAGALCGGLLIGPFGLVLGATAGVIFASQPTIEPLSRILLDGLKPATRDKLVNRFNNIVRRVEPEDVILFVLTNDRIKKQVIEMLRYFVRTELELSFAISFSRMLVAIFSKL